jgi:hypothetical protein
MSPVQTSQLCRLRRLGGRIAVGKDSECGRAQYVATCRAAGVGAQGRMLVRTWRSMAIAALPSLCWCRPRDSPAEALGAGASIAQSRLKLRSRVR